MLRCKQGLFFVVDMHVQCIRYSSCMNTETDLSLSVLTGAYFRNGPNAAASTVPTLIRPCRSHATTPPSPSEPHPLYPAPNRADPGMKGNHRSVLPRNVRLSVSVSC